MAPHAGFDTEQIRDKARKDLLYLLEGVRGKKNLVIEKNLVGPLGVIVKASTLRDYGVDNFYVLENNNTDTSQRNVVFIARGECARHAQSIADQIRRLQRESQTNHEFHVFWVPRRTLVADKVLEEAGVLGDANIAELPLYFFPLERDVLSLELDDSFQDLYLSKDPTSIFLLSRALMGIQQKHGLFPRIIGKGDNAKRVAELLSRMRQELLAGEDASETDKIGLTPSIATESVIIIDREVDFVTPLLTQLTYEGLIDEVFGIENNQTDVDSTIVGAAAPSSSAQGTSAAPASNGPSRKRKIQLDSSDKLFGQLRDANFAIVGSLLNKVARRLQSDYESRHSSKTTAELKKFVEKLPGYQAEQQSLKIHTGLAEEIMKYTRTDNFTKLLEVQQNLAAGADPSSQFEAIEELIARDAPLPQVLRLLCIYSCISGGIKTKELDHFRRLILQGYGYQHLLTLHNLEKLQMFLSRSSPLASMIPMTGSANTTGTKTNYTYLRKQLRLIVDEVNEHDPNDIAYVYSGYAPLSIRLVQCVLQKQYLLSITRGNGVTSAAGAAGGGAQGWRGFDDAVKHARGQSFDEVQKGEDKAVKARALLSGGGEKKTVFVVFVGGISFTEIAALRFIAKKEEVSASLRAVGISTLFRLLWHEVELGDVSEDDYIYLNDNYANPPRALYGSNLDIMETDSRIRAGQVSNSGFGKGPLLKGLKELIDSHRLPANLGKPPSPVASSLSSSESDLEQQPVFSRSSNSIGIRHDTSSSSNGSTEHIAPEIVVWTEDMDDMIVDTPGSMTPAQEHAATPPATLQVPTPHGGGPTTIGQGPSFTSSLSAISDMSELSDVPPSPSSKATTPVDVDSSKELPSSSQHQSVRPGHSQSTRNTLRRRYDIRPKVSLPPDLPLSEYAMQCIAAAESSRLNPYALHQEEYLMLRDHISHAQVTTYLNIRNGILRLFIRNPQIVVTREEAIGCAKDTRWFDVASLCYDWLVRRGYINFGCVEVKSSRKQAKKDKEKAADAPSSPGSSNGKRKTVVVIGAGMAGLGCARQLEGLFMQYSKKFREAGQEAPRVVVLEGRNRIGGRVYSRAFATKPPEPPTGVFQGKRCTAEMGGMIITGFDRGNPLNVLVRGQLGLSYHALRPEATFYDSNGKPVDLVRDQLVEKLYNDCLDRVSEYKFKPPATKLIEGNRELMDEGKDSSAEVHKTIRQVEEATATQPDAPLPISEQNMAPQVNLVPVSSDRATGRVHTEPGTPGALKAATKAKLMGWALKHGVADDADLDVEAATKEPNATLGSVTDNVITQYKNSIVDLTAQDFRLMNWHIANLEYSNATNYNQLSLQGWDIDAGNEWEGKHTMIIGGYQSVPRGLMHIPTPLDVRQKSPVSRIRYTNSDGRSTTGPAVVECEDGYTVEADYVVSTIPLGVLKHGNVTFEPPLPDWKAGAISRLGFGVLNKVILVYREAFWDEDRDIFGVLRSPLKNRHSLDQKDYASQRGRFFQWFNVSNTSGLPVLMALMAGDAGFDTEQTCNDDLVAEATAVLRSVYGNSRVPNPVEAVVTRWASDKFARGSYSSAGPDMRADDYDTMARPIGNLFFAGEHTCGTHPATVHGAYLSGLRAASEVLDVMLGPIDMPTPLIIPKELQSQLSASSVLSKRKAAAISGPEAETPSKDPAPAARSREEAYEIELWDHIIAQIGLRPLKPTKPAASSYVFWLKVNYEEARRRCEEAIASGRRLPGVGRGRIGKQQQTGGNGEPRKPNGNEVRIMSAKMWKETTAEEKKPFEEQAEEQKRAHAKVMAEFNEQAAEWDRKATELKEAYEREHPLILESEGQSKTRNSSASRSAAGRGSRSASHNRNNKNDTDVPMPPPPPEPEAMSSPRVHIKEEPEQDYQDQQMQDIQEKQPPEQVQDHQVQGELMALAASALFATAGTTTATTKWPSTLSSLLASAVPVAPAESDAPEASTSSSAVVVPIQASESEPAAAATATAVVDDAMASEIVAATATAPEPEPNTTSDEPGLVASEIVAAAAASVVEGPGEIYARGTNIGYDDDEDAEGEDEDMDIDMGL
ncbi:Sec1-like protein [Diplogelasinospora grovesii]|uniref:Sec1-like protein n=1 Tax=Diplogelasinospora grovesii TaxID=303347 RepID=A0AAN6NEG3_9PEZI|nr:Sec1-like protein [Diplogelasinospora grovesii]